MGKGKGFVFTNRQIKVWSLSAMSAGITALLFVIFFPVIKFSVYLSWLFAAYAALVGAVVLLVLRNKKTSLDPVDMGRAMSGIVNALLVALSWFQYATIPMQGVYVPGYFVFPALTVVGLIITLFLSVPLFPKARLTVR